MRKFVCAIISIMLLGNIACAEDLNQSQIELRNNVKIFLQEEGFLPEFDSDGDLCFKKEGNKYWITIVPEVASPMLLVLCTGYNNPEEFDENTIKLASAELNKYKGVKVVCYPDSFVIESDMFLMNADQFKHSFYVIMSQIASVAGDFYDECSKAKEILTSRNGYSSSRDNFITGSISVPSNKINTDYHIWEVISVELQDNCTYVHKRVTPKTSSTWVWGDTNEFIEDAQTGKRYYLTHSTFSMSPQKTILNGTSPRDFTETYPVLPTSVKYINISSGSQYYIKNLKIR